MQKSTLFSFCLRLPQHRYFSKEDRIEEIYSPVSKQSISKKNSKITGIIGFSQQLFTTPETKGKKEGTTTVTPSTPKMNILFTNISDAKTGYYGGLGLLDK